MGIASIVRRHQWLPRFSSATAFGFFAAVMYPSTLFANPLSCGRDTDPTAIAAAFRQIRSRVDPCGESAQVTALLDKLEHCPTANYEICTDVQSYRNSFDRPDRDRSFTRTITWNPSLRTTIDFGCHGDPNEPVPRDATASLLHELAHAAQDCDGLDPNEHEFDAVRIENIYRRAAGLCQRTRYGSEPLPPAMLTACEPGSCACTLPGDGTHRRPSLNPPRQQQADGPDDFTSADGQPAGMNRP